MATLAAFLSFDRDKLRFRFSSLIPHISRERSRLLGTGLVNVKVNPEMNMETPSRSSYTVWKERLIQWREFKRHERQKVAFELRLMGRQKSTVGGDYQNS